MIIGQDNTRIEGEDIKTEYLPDNLNQTIEERCKNNDILSLYSATTLLNRLYVSGRNNGDLLFRLSYNQNYNIGKLEGFNREEKLESQSIIVNEGKYDGTDTRGNRRYVRIPVKVSSYSGNKLMLKDFICYVDYGTSDGMYSSVIGHTSNMFGVHPDQPVGEWYDAPNTNQIQWQNNLNEIDANDFPFGDVDFIIECPNMAINSTPNYVKLSYVCQYYYVANGTLTINDDSPIVRFRIGQSNKTDEVIGSPGDVIRYDENNQSYIGLGDIIQGQTDKYLYNGDNLNGNPASDPFFSVIPGDKDTSAKTELISYDQNLELSEDSQTLVSRMSKLQTIPKLLINNKNIMKIRTINENKTSNDKDGFNVKGLKINDVENNYRFGAYPDIYPIYAGSFNGQDSTKILVDNEKLTIQNKQYGSGRTVKTYDYNPNKDQIVLYQQSGSSSVIEKQIPIQYYPTISNGGDRGVGFAYGYAGIDNYSDTIKITLDTQIKKYKINTSVEFNNDESGSEKGLTSFDHNYLDSIYEKQTNTKTIELKNVGDGAKDNSSYFDIGSGVRANQDERVIKLSTGVVIECSVEEYIFQEELKFSNSESSNKNTAGDIYCHSSVTPGVGYETKFEGYLQAELKGNGILPNKRINLLTYDPNNNRPVDGGGLGHGEKGDFINIIHYALTGNTIYTYDYSFGVFIKKHPNTSIFKNFIVLGKNGKNITA